MERGRRGEKGRVRVGEVEREGMAGGNRWDREEWGRIRGEGWVKGGERWGGKGSGEWGKEVEGAGRRGRQG